MESRASRPWIHHADSLHIWTQRCVEVVHRNYDHGMMTISIEQRSVVRKLVDKNGVIYVLDAMECIKSSDEIGTEARAVTVDPGAG